MGPELAPSPAHRARVQALPWLDLRKRLLKRSAFLGIPSAEAEDLIHAGLLKLLNVGAGTWNHERDPDGFAFLLRAMDDRWGDAKKRRARRRTDLDSDKVDQEPPSSDRGAEPMMLARERATEARAELLRRLEGSPLTCKVAELYMAEGVLKPGEVAARLGQDVKVIYVCAREIRDAVKRIHESTRKAEAGREAVTA
jgi:DNA-directed RNA polymerase specialized sigma24 family protein